MDCYFLNGVIYALRILWLYAAGVVWHFVAHVSGVSACLYDRKRCGEKGTQAVSYGAAAMSGR